MKSFLHEAKNPHTTSQAEADPLRARSLCSDKGASVYSVDKVPGTSAYLTYRKNWGEPMLASQVRENPVFPVPNAHPPQSFPPFGPQCPSQRPPCPDHPVHGASPIVHITPPPHLLAPSTVRSLVSTIASTLCCMEAPSGPCNSPRVSSIERRHPHTRGPNNAHF